jgi:hypothetical protein
VVLQKVRKEGRAGGREGGREDYEARWRLYKGLVRWRALEEGERESENAKG